jgi:pilus assembly protein FimV
MGKRLAPIFAVMAMLTPLAGHALGLGNISMKSALNEPLDAEIELISVEKGDLSNLLVRLGSEDDFTRVGADRAFFLTKIKFSIEKKPDGTPYVKLTTADTVTEPYLDFVVEARWPRGRILREFTVLVDPPSMTKEAPAPIQQAVTQPAPAPAPAATPAPAPAPVVQQAAPIPSRATLTPVMSRDGGLSYGPVKRNDTLWEIANQMRPDDSISVNQVMLALVRDNPKAFYNGNVNQLKAGYVLRIEDPSSMANVTVAQADAEVERQRMEWQARKSGKLIKQTAVAEAPQAGAPAGAGASEAEKARLKLVAPGSEGAGSGAGDAEVDQLRQDLLIAAEALDANRQETDELKSRLAEMEEQLASMQRLIMLKDDEMLALQKQLGKVPEDATKPAPMESAAPTAEGEMAKAEMVDESLAGAGMAEEAMPAEKPVAAEKPAAEEKAKPKKPKVEAPEIPEPGLFENPLILYGAGGAIILGLIAWLVMRRRKMQDGFQESILNVGGEGAEGVAMDTVETGGESSMVSDFAMSEMSDMDGIQADSTEVDPISEADVYLAYGRHQQAEDIIKDAMEKTPDRHELKLKMLEVYFAAKNAEAFTKQAEELHEALGDESDPLWAKAVTMGSQLCPTNELFGGSPEAEVDPLQEQLAGGVSEADEDLLDFDFDMDSAGLDEDLEAATADDGDLDFDLDFDKVDEAAATESSAVAETATEAGDDSGLDFDVSSLDFDLDQTNEGDESKAASAEAEVAVAEGEQDQADDALDFDLGDLAESGDETAASTEDELALDSDLSSADDLSLGDMSLDMEEPASGGATADVELDMADTLTADQGLEMESTADSSLDMGLADLDLADMGEETSTAQEVAANELGDALGDDLGGDIFAEVDEVGTKLDLAKAYVDMGDGDGARSILDEVLEEGNDDQKQQAQELLTQIG